MIRKHTPNGLSNSFMDNRLDATRSRKLGIIGIYLYGNMSILITIGSPRNCTSEIKKLFKAMNHSFSHTEIDTVCNSTPEIEPHTIFHCSTKEGSGIKSIKSLERKTFELVIEQRDKSFWTTHKKEMIVHKENNKK